MWKHTGVMKNSFGAAEEKEPSGQQLALESRMTAEDAMRERSEPKTPVNSYNKESLIPGSMMMFMANAGRKLEEGTFKLAWSYSCFRVEQDQINRDIVGHLRDLRGSWSSDLLEGDDESIW